MLGRLVCAGFCAFFASAVGCGGSVKQGTGDPAEQLTTGGADRCKAACVTLVACGIGTKSCDCSCPPCPADSPSCECPACDCTSEATTPSDCENSCGKAVKKVLEETPACDGAMVNLLDCVASATCKKGEEPCQAESGAMKACTSANRGSTSPPPMGAPDTDPGDPGSPGTPTSPGSVACHLSYGTSPPSGRDGSSPPPGASYCESVWDDCSDGRSYDVECSVTNDATALACTCNVNHEPGISFSTMGCVTSVDEVNARCGWHLE